MKTSYFAFILAVLGLGALLTGCDQSGKDVYEEEVVLQGTMYVGHPLSVRLTRTVPIEEAYDQSHVGVSGATVKITADEHEFTLLEETNNPSGAGFYSLPADSHLVTPGVHYSIRAEAEGRVLTAQTTAAGYIQDLTQNQDTVMYGSDPLVFRWTPDTLAFGYFAVVESLNPNWRDPQDADWASGNNGAAMADGNFSFWNIPWRDDSLAVPWIMICYTGQHVVRLFTCDKAYWDYTMTLRLGSAYNRPISNVQGGLGIFSAGDVDTTSFVLVKNPNLHHGVF